AAISTSCANGPMPTGSRRATTSPSRTRRTALHGGSRRPGLVRDCARGAGTHNPECAWLCFVGRTAHFNNWQPWLWVPAFAGTTTKKHHGRDMSATAAQASNIADMVRVQARNHGDA